MANESHCAGALASHSALAKLMPPNCMAALTTPIKAPPAMKPEARSVPRSPRRLFNSAEVEREVTYQLTAPPTMSGRLSCKGMNMPRAKARAEMPQALSRSEMRAPMP